MQNDITLDVVAEKPFNLFRLFCATFSHFFFEFLSFLLRCFYLLLIFQKAITENAIIESTKESTSDCRIARQLLWTKW